MKKIIKDVCGAFIEVNGLVLVAQRNEGDSFGLKWEFPGGSIEQGETKENCIIRELEEELGVIGEPESLIGVFEDEMPSLKIIIYLYKCNILRGEPKPLECKEVRWVKFNELESLDLAPADRKIFESLKKDYYAKNQDK